MRIRRLLLLMVVFALVGFGCGSDSSGSSAEADQDAVAAAIASFEVRARSDGFRLDDDDDDDDDVNFESEECKKFEEAFPGDDHGDLPGQTASLDSKSFTRGEFDGSGGVEETLEASAGTVESPEDLETFFELLHDARLESCLKEGLEAAFKEGAGDAGGDVSIVGLQVSVSDVMGVGDQALRIGVTASLGVAGIQVPIALDFVFAGAGRAAAMVGATSIGRDTVSYAVPDSLRKLLTDIRSAV